MATGGPRLSTHQLILLRVVVAARNAGEPDVPAAVAETVGHPVPSRESVLALSDVLDAVGFSPGEPAAAVIARVVRLLAEEPGG